VRVQGLVRPRLQRRLGVREEYDPEGSLLRGRKFVLVCPAGSSERQYRKYRYDETFRNLVEVGTLSYCGVTEVETHIFFEVYWDEEATAGYLPKAREIGRTAFGRPHGIHTPR